MPDPASTRLALVGPSASDLVSQGDDIMRAMIVRLEAAGAAYAVGTDAGKGAAAAANAGQVYLATDTARAYVSTGSAWWQIPVTVAPASGKSIIATTEARTNVAYGLLTTPDRVSGVVLPTDGLIRVAYQATWQESVAGAARAAIFVGANQQTVGEPGAPGTIAAATNAGVAGNSANRDTPLFSTPFGLASLEAASTYTGDVTTGQALGNFVNATAYKTAMEPHGSTVVAMASSFGGTCQIFAAAGTYDITVQFKASSGSVTAKNRKLWVRAEGF